MNMEETQHQDIWLFIWLYLEDFITIIFLLKYQHIKKYFPYKFAE